MRQCGALVKLSTMTKYKVRSLGGVGGEIAGNQWPRVIQVSARFPIDFGIASTNTCGACNMDWVCDDAGPETTTAFD